MSQGSCTHRLVVLDSGFSRQQSWVRIPLGTLVPSLQDETQSEQLGVNCSLTRANQCPIICWGRGPSFAVPLDDCGESHLVRPPPNLRISGTDGRGHEGSPCNGGDESSILSAATKLLLLCFQVQHYIQRRSTNITGDSTTGV